MISPSTTASLTISADVIGIPLISFRLKVKLFFILDFSILALSTIISFESAKWTDFSPEFLVFYESVGNYKVSFS